MNDITVKKILLLNPPGKQIYHRDYYCSCVSKADYYYHPMDLVFLSGMLSFDYVVYLIDAIAEKLTPDEARARIVKMAPHYILSLVSAPSYEEDTLFLADLKKNLPKTVFIGTGDIYRDYREKSLKKQPFLEAILLDFSTGDILKYLKGDRQGHIIDNMIYKAKGKIYSGPEKHGSGYFHIPIPRWDLFPLDSYRFPFSLHKKFVRMLTDFGCPYGCTFCTSGTLGFKLRDLDTVIEEMKFLIKLGVADLYLADYTFGVNRERSFELLKRMQEEKLKFSWTAFTRVDMVSFELLAEMAKTGCHTIMIGVESGSEDILKEYHKNTKINQLTAFIKMAKKLNMRILGTFIIGLPGESRESVLKTIEMATNSGLDYASFNLATARHGTPFRKEMIAKGYISENDLSLDSAKAKPRWKKSSLTNEEILDLQKLAIRRFYLRPGYILKRLFSVRNFYEFKRQIAEGWALMRENIVYNH